MEKIWFIVLHWTFSDLPAVVVYQGMSRKEAGEFVDQWRWTPYILQTPAEFLEAQTLPEDTAAD